MTTKPPLYMIGGPTASGKTAAALKLAQQEDGVIINTDAMQVYRGLPLLTAQPTVEEKAEADHRLFEIFDPFEKSSAGRWLKMARREIRQVAQEGKTPILVGGTGLYFAALLGELADIPLIPESVRAQTCVLYDDIGHDTFRRELAKMDEIAAQKIKPNDRQRLIRAYEVAKHTGKTLVQWHEEGRATSIENEFTVWRRVLMPEREALYAACDARFLKMIEAGALDEVRALLDRLQQRHCETSSGGMASGAPNGSPQPASRLRDDANCKATSFKATLPFASLRAPSGAWQSMADDGPSLPQDLPAFKILGVPELASHLRGELSLDEAIARAQQSTRNYAKRQVTWFKNQWACG